jgi:hypothetical protein
MEKLKKVSSWQELIDFVESVNPYTNTIILTGFINEWKIDDSIHVKQLIFETRPVREIIVEKISSDFDSFKSTETVE